VPRTRHSTQGLSQPFIKVKQLKRESQFKPMKGNLSRTQINDSIKHAQHIVSNSDFS
jgi:hypothetical protein